MQTETRLIRSWSAIALAGVCVAGTGYVLFEDVIRGGVINVGHVTGVIALIVTIAAGHMLWGVLQLRPFAALGLALIFAGGTGFIVVTSAGRTAHVMADKTLAATDHNNRYLKAIADLETAKQGWKDAAAAAVAECASGKKTRCEGRQLSADKAETHMRILQVRADALKPVHTDSDYLQAAKLFAAIGFGTEKELEAKLALVMPFLLALLCEIGAIVFGNLAFERHKPAPAKKALTFERPLSPQEIEDAKKVLTAEDVRSLRAEGLNQQEIAARYKLNQGRVSELETGKRHAVALRVLN